MCRDVFEQWCFRRILKIGWKDRVSKRTGFTQNRIRKATFQENTVFTDCQNRNWHMLDMCDENALV